MLGHKLVLPHPYYYHHHHTNVCQEPLNIAYKFANEKGKLHFILNEELHTSSQYFYY